MQYIILIKALQVGERTTVTHKNASVYPITRSSSMFLLLCFYENESCVAVIAYTFYLN